MAWTQQTLCSRQRETGVRSPAPSLRRQCFHHGGKALNLVQVLFGKTVQEAVPRAGGGDAHLPAVACVLCPRDQSGGFGAVDELTRRMVAQHQVFGDLPDRWRTPAAADREQKLVLHRRQPDALGRLLTPSQEPAERLSELC